MCKAIDGMRKESKAEGISIGEDNKLKENIKTMHKNGADENLISKLLGLDISFVRKVLAE
jgi:hypothetical protein